MDKVEFTSNNNIYKTNADNSARFLLGTKGNKPLICFGVNPSTAEPGNPDSTVKRIQGFVESWGYDSYLIFNLYPQRATNPDDLHKIVDLQIHQEHLIYIEEVFRSVNAPIWAAWGNLIESRSYLSSCLDDIKDLALRYGRDWYRAGTLTKKNHPRHPLYLKAGTKLHKICSKSPQSNKGSFSS